jgi:hypothetical protein
MCHYVMPEVASPHQACATAAQACHTRICPADIKAECDERLHQFLADWQQAEHPLPPEAHEQHLAIDALHADLIHLQEEKNVFVFQVLLVLLPVIFC